LARVERGEANMPSSGFGGKGLERLENEREMVKKAQKRVRLYIYESGVYIMPNAHHSVV
jgi:hypothetical protein